MSQEETKNTPYGQFQGFVVAFQNGPLVAVIYTLYLARPLRAKRETEYVKAKSEQKKPTTKEGKSDVDKISDIVSELKSNTFSISLTTYENNLCMMCETEDETLDHFI